MLKKLFGQMFAPKDPFAPRTRGSGFQRFIRALIVATVVLVTVRLVWGCSSSGRLDRAMSQARQAKLPLKMLDVPLPTVSEDQDAWPIYVEMLRTAGQRGVGMAPLLEAQAQQQTLSEADKARLAVAKADESLLKNWHPGDALEATWKQQMAERLSLNQDLLAQLAQGARKGSIRWRVTDDPTRPLEVDPLPLMTLARLMLARAAIALEEGRTVEGLDDLGVVFRVGYLVRQCPIVEMHPMEAVLAMEASAVLQRALPSIDVPRESFARLIADCQGGPVGPSLRTATQFTTAWLHKSYRTALAGGHGALQAVEMWAFRPYIDSSHARALELLMGIMPMIDGSYAHFIGPIEQRWLQAGGGPTGEWLRANMQRVLSAAHAAAVAETYRAMSQVALATRSWQTAHGGALPDSLDVLAGDLLPALPADPMTDGPFQYVATDAPRLYSLGLDRKDNQGFCDRKDDALGQKEHDICFFLAGLPANPVTASRPATAPASGPTTAPVSTPTTAPQKDTTATPGPA